MSRNSRRRRDTFDITNRRLPALLSEESTFRFPSAPIRVDPVRDVREDRRFYQPGIIRTVQRSARRLKSAVPLRPLRSSLKSRLYGVVPVPLREGYERLVCSRRKVRREIIFALGAGGRGVKKRKPRYNSDSLVKCWR